MFCGAGILENVSWGPGWARAPEFLEVLRRRRHDSPHRPHRDALRARRALAAQPDSTTPALAHPGAREPLSVQVQRERHQRDLPAGQHGAAAECHLQDEGQHGRLAGAPPPALGLVDRASRGGSRVLWVPSCSARSPSHLGRCRCNGRVESPDAGCSAAPKPQACVVTTGRVCWPGRWGDFLGRITARTLGLSFYSSLEMTFLPEGESLGMETGPAPLRGRESRRTQPEVPGGPSGIPKSARVNLSCFLLVWVHVNVALKPLLSGCLCPLRSAGPGGGEADLSALLTRR